MITKKKDGWHLMSSDGKKHIGGPYNSREEAVKRERQVNFFKYLQKRDPARLKKIQKRQ
jgi:hypothetical protein